MISILLTPGRSDFIMTLFGGIKIMPEKEAAKEAEKGSMNKKILIVEDDAKVRGMICQIIQGLEEKYDLVEAADGQEGLAKAESENPDLIVLDLFLPLMSGFELCQKIREHPKLQKVRILAITGLPEDNAIKRIYDAGADLCIMKPLHIDHFRFELRRLLSEP